MGVFLPSPLLVVAMLVFAWLLFGALRAVYRLIVKEEPLVVVLYPGGCVRLFQRSAKVKKWPRALVELVREEES